jgi:hypothetical protein
VPTTARAAAGAIRGCRGELRFRPAAGPNKPSPTFPCTSPSSLACPFPPLNRHLAGTAAATATAAGRRHPHLAGPPPPQPSPGISPLGPKGQSPPALGRPRLAVHRNLAGPLPAGARGPHCEATTLSEDQIANRGYLCKHLKLLGVCVKMCSGIVFDLLQKLVKSVKNRKKS